MRIKYIINFKKKNCIINKGKNYVFKNSFKIIEHFNLEYMPEAAQVAKREKTKEKKQGLHPDSV